MRIGYASILVLASVVWVPASNAHFLDDEHIHLFTDPDYGSLQYLTARDSALAKLPNDPKKYITLRHEVVRANWPAILDVFQAEQIANGPFYLSFFGHIECTVSHLERRPKSPSSSSKTEAFKGKCREFNGRARVQMKYDADSGWLNLTFTVGNREIVAVLVDDEYVVILEVRRLYKHGD